MRRAIGKLGEARNPKLEIRNKLEYQNTNALNEMHTVSSIPHS